MSYGYQPAPRKSGMTTAGKWMFLIGLVLSVLAAIVFFWGLSRTIDFAQEMESESVSLATGPQTVAMEADDTRLVLNDPGVGETTCTVTLPDGSETPLSPPDSTQESAMQEAQMELVGAYTAQEEGEHVYTCEGGNPTLTPGVTAGDIGAVAAAGLGALALLPLGLLTIVGLILWLVGRSKDKKALAGPFGSSGPGYGGDSGYPGERSYQQTEGYGQSTAYPEQGQGGYGQAPPPPPGYGQPPISDPYAAPQGEADRDRREDDGRG